MMWLPSLIFGVWTLFSHSTAESAMQEAKHFVVDIVSINGEEFVVKDEAGRIVGEAILDMTSASRD